MKVFLSVLFLSAAVSNANTASNCDDSNFKEITKTELKKLVETKSAFVVDVNSEESYKKHHVDTAVHYGKDFAKNLPANKSDLIVAYCGGPSCGAWKKAAKEACKAGYTNVAHFKGGISGWIAAAH